MNPVNDTGAAELLANLSIGMVVAIALVLTILRIVLLNIKAPASSSGAADVMPYTRGLAEILESLVIAGVLVFLIIRPFFVQAFYIPSESMEDTLLGHNAGTSHTGDYHANAVHDHIFVNKLIYRFQDPQRGDIIVFRAPKEADSDDKMRGLPQQENVLIKRLIGIPGDTIGVHDGAVYRNGVRLDEPYIRKPANEAPMDPQRESDFKYATPGPLKLGADQLWVMGDNRNDSNDSRYWGPLDRSRVMGKASVIFWPLNRIRILK